MTTTSPQLPVPVEHRNEHTRRLAALNIGRELRWWTYDTVGATSKPSQLRFRVKLRNGVVRELLAEEVLAWALGVADSKRQGAALAYREGILP